MWPCHLWLLITLRKEQLAVGSLGAAQTTDGTSQPPVFGTRFVGGWGWMAAGRETPHSSCSTCRLLVSRHLISSPLKRLKTPVQRMAWHGALRRQPAAGPPFFSPLSSGRRCSFSDCPFPRRADMDDHFKSSSVLEALSPRVRSSR